MPLRDLDQGLALTKKFLCQDETFRQNFSEVSVRGIADRKPQNLRRRAKLLDQANEVAVFGQYGRFRFPSSEKNLAVPGIAQ